MTVVLFVFVWCSSRQALESLCSQLEGEVREARAHNTKLAKKLETEASAAKKIKVQRHIETTKQTYPMSTVLCMPIIPDVRI